MDDFDKVFSENQRFRAGLSSMTRAKPRSKGVGRLTFFSATCLLNIFLGIFLKVVSEDFLAGGHPILFWTGFLLYTGLTGYSVFLRLVALGSQKCYEFGLLFFCLFSFLGWWAFNSLLHHNDLSAFSASTLNALFGFIVYVPLYILPNGFFDKSSLRSQRKQLEKEKKQLETLQNIQNLKNDIENLKLNNRA
ncbi:MAG: hypothetical protein JWO78_1959 [Micavibrio sp.]|nr:hypothetical protein [Micavibrio sp.]